MSRLATSLLFVFLSAAGAQTIASRIASSADAFLATLDQKQRQTVLFAFDDAQQRVRWSNLPTGFVKRAGLSMRELNATQRSAALSLVSSVLSKRGFEKVQQIMQADGVLKHNEGNNPMFGEDLYYISILGTPSPAEPWILQFGGHHLALNITIAGERGILTPTLTGAQPALYTIDGKTIRPLGQESDKALALLNALDETQRKQAILSYRLADLVLGPGQDGKTIQPEGLKASGMNERQRAMLLDVIWEWAGIVHETAAAARMAELKADLGGTWFAWSGPVTAAPGANITAYYRIQGPHLVIEYAPQRLGGDPALHVHAMYRDPTNDYGRKLAAK
ncbi:MAG TPA: DUF3500 domain-containing protein [Candidatus Acidoferrales bacterium]|nr:DUF3500 domain-containing protein [Candidatus Acidoferrales bacterium]